jgi:hypothetical protein
MERRTIMMIRNLAMMLACVILLGGIGFNVVLFQQAKREEQRARLAEANLHAIGEGMLAYTNALKEKPVAMQDTEVSEAGELAAFEFLVGTWRGEMDGGLVEEIWSRPEGNAMMGMFRWLNAEGRSRMYELLTISREGDETFLRLRHFTSSMVAWEEKDAPVVMKLVESSTGRALFENVNEADRLERIVFHQPEAGKLAIDVEFSEESGRAPLNFRFDAVR